jgi:hypothetical protein
VNKAVNVAVDPAAIEIEEGLTDRLKDGGFGSGKPPPQPARLMMIKRRATTVRFQHFTKLLSARREQIINAGSNKCFGSAETIRTIP